jgi:hypothetical protein
MKKHLANWSKLWLFIIFVFGFVGYVLILCGWLVLNRADAHYMLLANTGLMSTCFGFYEWKARHENAEKIRGNPNYQDNAPSPQNIYDIPTENVGGDESAADITKEVQDESAKAQITL